MPKRYNQLSREERDRISIYVGQGRGVRAIGRLLDRHPGTISRELARNSPRSRDRTYLSNRAQLKSDARKAIAHTRERLRQPRLKAFVRKQLEIGWSPERIAGRWRLLGHGQISHEAIYQWVYTEAKAYIPCLHRARKKRLKRGHRSKPKGLRIPSRKSIRLRPKIVAGRTQAGHWEADTMIGKGCKSTLQILVERKTRLTRLTVLPRKSAPAMRRALNRALARYPKGLRRTITYDNGSENHQHLRVNKVLGTKSYFCAPMHSWEKGSVENAAGLVRRRLPNKTDFGIVPKKQIKETQRWLNELPRKCLGFRTPAEAFRRIVALTC